MDSTVKPNFPSKPCPKCGERIHARVKRHEGCGWVMADAVPALTVARKPIGRPRKTAGVRGPYDGITVADIAAVKAVVERLGASRVAELAEVLALP